MSVEDIIFIIRHDQTKVNRITDFLSWKDVRRNVKQANGGAGDDVEVVEEGLYFILFSHRVEKIKIFFLK